MWYLKTKLPRTRPGYHEWLGIKDESTLCAALEEAKCLLYEIGREAKMKPKYSPPPITTHDVPRQSWSRKSIFSTLSNVYNPSVLFKTHPDRVPWYQALQASLHVCPVAHSSQAQATGPPRAAHQCCGWCSPVPPTAQTAGAAAC